MSNLIYQVHQKPPFWQNILFALQQVMAIITATMLVPLLADATGVYLSQSAALIGAGVGTIIYLLFTRFKSPVFLGSSFTFILPLASAISFGYLGIFLGSLFAGGVYVILAIIIRFVGSDWVNKIMPPIIIGPVVALIGFNLASSAMSNMMNAANGEYNFIAILVGLFTFFVTILVSAKGKKSFRMFPFIIGIFAGYALAVILTLIGNATNTQALQLIDFSIFKRVANFSNWLPNFLFVGLFQEGTSKITSFGDVFTIFLAFVPIALVSFAEHIADHKNISSIVEKDLLKDPGLHRTLLGDGVGTMLGSFIGGCPTTTYGESIGCVAISRNASTRTILVASIMCIVIAFFYPFVVFIESLPTCVIGGVCIALYGFISVSGLRMMKKVDLQNPKSLFVVSAIFICGIGGLEFRIGSVVIESLACALIIGIVANFILSPWKKKNKDESPPDENTDKDEGNQGIENQTDENEESPNLDNSEKDENKKI